jgi:hypothetical protein
LTKANLNPSEKGHFNFRIKHLGFAPKLYKKRGSYELCLYGYAKFCKYIRMIGWSNEKHLEKAREFEKLWPNLAEGQGA